MKANVKKKTDSVFAKTGKQKIPSLAASGRGSSFYFPIIIDFGSHFNRSRARKQTKNAKKKKNAHEALHAAQKAASARATLAMLYGRELVRHPGGLSARDACTRLTAAGRFLRGLEKNGENGEDFMKKGKKPPRAIFIIDATRGFHYIEADA